MEAKAGTYALIFYCERSQEVVAGSLETLQLSRGYFIYVGSAFGPGGLKARVGHHLGYSKRPHWHLDYLRPFMRLEEIWFSYESVRREHLWANELSSIRVREGPFSVLAPVTVTVEPTFLRLAINRP